MDRFIGRYSAQIYALLRIVSGFLFLCHGLQAMFGILDGVQPPMFTQLWFGGALELVGGTLILIGFQSSWAAFVCSGMMAVGYFQWHQMNGALPIQNEGEPAVLYAFLFLFIASKGSGIWSLDAMLGKKNAG